MIFGVSQISWESSPWKHLSLVVNDEEVISLSHAKVYVFSDSVSCLGKMNQNATSNSASERQLSWFKESSQDRTLDTVDGEPVEFEWNISQDSLHCSSSKKSKSSMNKMGEPEQYQGRIIFMSMFNDISWRSQDNEQECELSASLVSIYARRFSPGEWSFLGPGSEKKWYSTHDSKPQGEWDRVAELMMIKFAESGHPVFQATGPLSRGTLKSRGGGQLSIHFCADVDTIETVFRTNVSVNQLSIYGAVSDLCEECKSCHVRTGRPVVAGQSDPLFVQARKLDCSVLVSSCMDRRS